MVAEHWWLTLDSYCVGDQEELGVHDSDCGHGIIDDN